MTESERTASRVVLVSGLAGAVLLLGALGVLGDLPDPHSGPAAVASYFIVHRTSVFVSLALAAAAAIAMLVFLASVRIRNRSRPLAATFSMAAASAVVGLLIVNELPYAALSWQIASVSATAAKSIFVLTIISPILQGPLFAAALVATASQSLLPSRYRVASVLCAVVAALAGVAFAQRGYLYPDVRQQVVGQLFVLWVIGSAVICSRRAVCCKVGR